MLAVEAAVGLEQLEKYPRIVQRRRDNATYYDQHLPRREGWVYPPVVDGATFSHYVVRVPNRDAVICEYAAKGIHLGELIQYSIPELECYRNTNNDCPLACLASAATVNFSVTI
jgi:dTDP-4-amino-4,6-dideoxygalactose transaminase